jgi:serum/glucocorticoid-regulated kinase 2
MILISAIELSANIYQTDAMDTANFDKEFTNEPATDSVVEGNALSSTMQQQFTGWSYNRPVAGLGDAGGSIKDPSALGSVRER